jgi:hypothetical protein
MTFPTPVKVESFDIICCTLTVEQICQLSTVKNSAIYLSVFAVLPAMAIKAIQVFSPCLAGLAKPHGCI